MEENIKCIPILSMCIFDLTLSRLRYQEEIILRDCRLNTVMLSSIIIIFNRLQNKIEQELPENQGGFR